MFIYKLFLFFWFVPLLHLISEFFFCVLDDFADRHAAEPNLSLVNKESLDNILRAEVFVHDDSQLWAAYLILGYKLISIGFQAPKCVIRAKDPLLHRISVAVPGFLLPERASVPEGTLSI